MARAARERSEQERESNVFGRMHFTFFRAPLRRSEAIDVGFSLLESDPLIKAVGVFS